MPNKLKHYINGAKFEYSIFHTGDGTSWVFEISYKGKLIGEGHGLPDHESALQAIKTFCSYYYIPQ